MKRGASHQFLALVSDFYREAGRDEPVFEFDPQTPIAFEACVEDVKLSVGYDPLSKPNCLFVYCVFGVVPLATDAATLRRLLALNIAMAQQHNAAYCIDDSTQELVCYLRATMDIDIQTLRAELAHIAQLAHRWRRDCFAEDGQSLRPAQKISEPASWTDFA